MNIDTLLGGLSLQAPTLQVVVRGICRMAFCCGGTDGLCSLSLPVSDFKVLKVKSKNVNGV